MLTEKERKFVDNSAENLIDFIVSTTIGDECFDWSWCMTREVAELVGDASLIVGQITGIDNALSVKRAIRSRLEKPITPAERLLLFRWFVTEYGQVANHRDLDEKIQNVLEIEGDSPEDFARRITLSGVSTTSKCLTLLDQNLPIYDSRVCYAMNAINFIHGSHCCYLSGPPGRNASLGLIDLRAQFLLSNVDRLERAIEDLKSGGRQRASNVLSPLVTSPRRTYLLWCEIMAKASSKLK